jgi:hypothetical protein
MFLSFQESKKPVTLLSKPYTVYVGRVSVYRAAGCIEVTVATAHPTKNLLEFQHTPAGYTRTTYTVCGLL